MSVVVGYIPTAEGRAALDEAVLQAKFRNSPLVLVNLRKDEALSDDRFASDQALSELAEQLTASGIGVEIVSARATSPSDALIDIAATHEADLIVIGLRRRSAVGKLLMGSTALEILTGAHCPVLSVRPQ
ncbi:universal stress protein [Arthrobacter nitrophenolicus]|uniref:Universal stress protein n=1 Tax=Arthrobacter nitrophenolicus TaxID=683150 RepID=A0A4V3B270_9MICC|nr:universal stress protein [Arthrobacter nitrophenolicus]TDL39688.1 universal stress protein [Arthrobacter nitrophenolicus]